MRDELEEVRFVSAIRQKLSEDDAARPAGIHASDLLDPRQAYFQKHDPRPITERQAMLFIIGKVLHTLVISLTDPQANPTASDSGTHEELGILYSPDLEHEGRPTEVKTNRSPFEPDPDRLQEELHIYLEQLCVYLVLMNVLSGMLWVLYLSLKDSSGRTYPAMRCYRVEIAPDDFAILERQILETRDLLTTALQTETPAALPLCRDWKCGTVCAWWETCKPEGRWPETSRRRWTI